MFQKTFLNLLIVAVTLNVALACNGYKARIIKAENCGGPDAVVTIEDGFSVKFNKKCEIVPTGCIINKAFKTAVSDFKVVKDGVLLKEGKIDMCSMADHAPGEVKEYLKLFGAPASCPVEEGKVCGDAHTVDFSKYKALLSMARGNIVIDSNIEHDTGKSCFHVELEITKG
ncbi:sporozoite-associated mosquito saliva protein 1 [Cochliomyia hominivorax]